MSVPVSTSPPTEQERPGTSAPRIHPILRSLGSMPAIRAIQAAPPRSGTEVVLGGISGSAGSAVTATLHSMLPNRVWIHMATDAEAAERIQADLESLLGSGVAHLYPPHEARFFSEESDPRIDGLKVEAVEALLDGHGRIFVTTPRAVQERMAMPDRLTLLHLELSEGDEIGLSLLSEELETMGYERATLVEEVGQFAVRGGLVDIFSLGLADPVRVEFWGDEITSIRSFDVADQRSTAEFPSVRLLPASFRPGGEAGSAAPRSLLEVLPTDSVLVAEEGVQWKESLEHNWAHARKIKTDREDSGERLADPETLLLPPGVAEEAIRSLGFLGLSRNRDHPMSLDTTEPPEFNRKLERLAAYLREEASRAASTLILCDNDGQAERLEEILFGSGGPLPHVQVGVGAIEAGFCLPSSPHLNVLTDHEIFARSRRVRSGRQFRGAMALESLAQLSGGDYVVHMDHGIGRFRGLERIEVGGRELEVLAIEYAGGEILRAPVYRLDLIERWVSGSDDSEPPSVHRIGGRRWKTLKRKTEEAIEQMTQELLELYAEREIAEGFAYSSDTNWQKEMEAAFLYDDTPDQRTSTLQVKRDMESSRPMDRLLCGDVGFGKTEVAIRAAFKAIQDGRQVAFLAPTTILVEQHRRTIEERLADFPVTVASLSRFRSATEQEEILLGLERGEIDLVVGTHRLLSKDVTFRTLGLLVVDEEQRFGVKHKERLKQLRTTVDVLTLSATPIPRTLQLSLAGVRSLSLIRTPPRDRLSVTTQSIPWSDGLLGEIMLQELDRGGQIYFVHNRVETIHTIAERVGRLVPDAAVAVAHGQMNPGPLEEVMRDFIDGAIDVLVCSSIIENGLDVPNANTLIVDRADRFGLAQLYQIRGRVGRSNRRAYCYLIAPEGISEEARERIRVLERHTELGSGYQVALRDLELRGAGNLLGSNQSGFAHAVGMDTYLRLLEVAVRRIKGGAGAREDFPEPEVSLPGSAFVPDSYVSDSGQKLHLYRRLSKLADRSEVERLRDEMADRYGPIPDEVERLVDARLLRLLGQQLGIERIYVKDREGRLNFRATANPRLTALQRPFRDRQVDVSVRRMTPLSLTLHQAGAEPLTRTLIRALDVLVDSEDDAGQASS